MTHTGKETADNLITLSKASKAMDISWNTDLNATQELESSRRALLEHCKRCLDNEFNLVNLCMSNKVMYYRLDEDAAALRIISQLNYEIIDRWYDCNYDQCVMHYFRLFDTFTLFNLPNVSPCVYQEIPTLEIQQFNDRLLNKLQRQYKEKTLQTREGHGFEYLLEVFWGDKLKQIHGNEPPKHHKLLNKIQTIDENQTYSAQTKQDSIAEILKNDVNIFHNKNEMKKYFEILMEGFRFLFDDCDHTPLFKLNPNPMRSIKKASRSKHHKISPHKRFLRDICEETFHDILEYKNGDGKFLIQIDNNPNLEEDFAKSPNELVPFQNLVTCLFARKTRLGILTNIHHSILILLHPRGVDPSFHPSEVLDFNKIKFFFTIRYKRVNHNDSGLTLNWLLFYTMGLIMDSPAYEGDEHELYDTYLCKFETEDYLNKMYIGTRYIEDFDEEL